MLYECLITIKLCSTPINTNVQHPSSLSSAEAPVSEHQRKKRERERWREKTGAASARRGYIFPMARL